MNKTKTKKKHSIGQISFAVVRPSVVQQIATIYYQSFKHPTCLEISLTKARISFTSHRLFLKSFIRIFWILSKIISVKKITHQKKKKKWWIISPANTAFELKNKTPCYFSWLIVRSLYYLILVLHYLFWLGLSVRTLANMKYLLRHTDEYRAKKEWWVDRHSNIVWKVLTSKKQHYLTRFLWLSLWSDFS